MATASKAIDDATAAGEYFVPKVANLRGLLAQAAIRKGAGADCRLDGSADARTASPGALRAGTTADGYCARSNPMLAGIALARHTRGRMPEGRPGPRRKPEGATSCFRMLPRFRKVSR